MLSIKNTVLDNALKLVPFDGWTDYTITQAARSAGVSELQLKSVFPSGVNDCVAFFQSRENDCLVKILPPECLAGLRIPERIEKVILTRLADWQQKREIIRRTISFNALPWKSLSACKSLYNSVDLMWRIVGDKSTDFSFYTKRATLAAIYSSTVLFWLDDNSENQHETTLFLKRRLENLASFGRFKKQVKCSK